jgi:myo-inositol 2-dehydrogenase/D-chiro-inositol 1-dehydrogenase
MLGIAILGAGRIGKIHAACVAANPRAKLVVIADPLEAGAGPLAKRYGASATCNPAATIERDDVDAVIIGTPTPTHVELMLHAAKLGKAVPCEKPVDLNLARAEMVAAEVERLGAPVMVAFNRRFDTTAQALRAAIDAGEIGNVRQVIVTSRDPALPPREYLRTSGGIFRDMSIHAFDMARWFLGEGPIEVQAFGSRLVGPSIEEFDNYDTVMVQMHTASGKQCHINCCREAVYGYDQRFEIYGLKGMLLNENLRPSTIRRWSGTSTEAREPLLNFFLERYAQAYAAELDAFVDALVEERPMPVTVCDGCLALKLADCAVESAATGRMVRVQ